MADAQQYIYFACPNLGLWCHSSVDLRIEPNYTFDIGLFLLPACGKQLMKQIEDNVITKYLSPFENLQAFLSFLDANLCYIAEHYHV